MRTNYAKFQLTLMTQRFVIPISILDETSVEAFYIVSYRPIIFNGLSIFPITDETTLKALYFTK